MISVKSVLSTLALICLALSTDALKLCPDAASSTASSNKSSSESTAASSNSSVSASSSSASTTSPVTQAPAWTVDATVVYLNASSVSMVLEPLVCYNFNCGANIEMLKMELNMGNAKVNPAIQIYQTVDCSEEYRGSYGLDQESTQRFYGAPLYLAVTQYNHKNITKTMDWC